MIEDVEARLPLDQYELAALWLREVGVLYLEMFDWMAAGGLDLLKDFPDDIPEPIHDMVDTARRSSALDVRRDEMQRTKVWRAIQEVFSRFDGLLTPTLGALPVPNAENGTTVGPASINGRPVERCIGWCLTHPFNLTGHPAASVPAGLAPGGLPVGLQVVGRRLMDENVIAISRHVEEIRPWRAALHDAAARIADAHLANEGMSRQGV
jgi:amidase/aspartyl-tRNA(Asn)/glutamyl-tRNA(Gln) amidotransferase subunit A